MVILESHSIKEFLADELAKRTKTNPLFSQRAFARMLGLSPGEFSEVLRGKRKLSMSSASKISKTLDLNPTETKHLLLLAQAEKNPEVTAQLKTDHPSETRLNVEMFHIVSNWYCFAVLNLADTSDFRPNAAWIARRLGISKNEAQLALDRLQKVELIQIDAKGNIHVTKDYVLSPEGIPSEATRNYHKDILEKAIQSIDTQAVDDREFVGAGMAIHPKHLPAIKKEVSEFVDQLVAKYQSGKKTEVYQLELALFKLTQRGEPK